MYVYIHTYTHTHTTGWVNESINTCMFSGGARCSSVVRVFAHGAMGRQIDPSWWTH